MSSQQEQTSSYRSIFKATSLFGGVQVYQILIGVIKSKFIAILLGPAGMGIQGLYQSGIELIQGFSSLGLSQSAVRDVAEANGSGDTKRIGLTVAVLRRLVWITGLLGLVATIIFSPVLSKTSFGNYDYTIPFILLSIILLLNQLSAGQKVVLQGMRKLKYLAKSTAIGSTIGLLVSIPLYYLLGVKGIVPTLILSSFTSLCLTWYFQKKVKIEKVKVTNKQTFKEGKSMLKMGIAMSISGILVSLSSYILRSFIRFEGGTEQVGLFVAGFYIMNYYTGTIFTAMSTDYYPRLSGVNKDNVKCKEVINQQGEVATLIVTPLLVLCLIIMPFLVKFLYSEKFLPATDYILWMVIGIMFKTSSWVISFVFLAKAESKLFMLNETISNVYCLIFNIIGYKLGGLMGLGLSFTLNYFIYTLQVYLIARKRYDFSYTKSFKQVYFIQFALLIIGFAFIHLWHSNLVYLITVPLLIICTLYSLKELNKKMNLLQFIKQRK